MLRLLILGLTLIISQTGFSQDKRIAEILKQPENRLPYYEMTQAGSEILFLPMKFGESGFTISQMNALEKLKDATIAQVDLVYSDYPAKQDFSPLSKKRLESLAKLLPAIFKDPSINFRKMRQTIGATKDVAETLDHGFFIYFRKRPTKATAKEEVKKLKELLGMTGEPEGTLFEPDTVDVSADSTWQWWCGGYFVSTDTVGMWYEMDVIKEIKKMSKKDFNKLNLFNLDSFEEYKNHDSIYYVITKDNGCPDYLSESYSYFSVDTTVSKVFRRNKWKEAFILADVTGSMYPYTGQLLQWLKLNMTDKKKKHFLFFNDGDTTADEHKIIGKTGGIYPTHTDSYDIVEKTIEKAMIAGGGGDAPENNIEAIIEAVKICTNCDSIIMIADNWAPIKDISMVGSIGKPVKVVVCGVMGRIHKDYLKLARDTKGSIHLMEEDIYQLAELKEGESIKIGGITYRLIKGEFISEGKLSL